MRSPGQPRLGRKPAEDAFEIYALCRTGARRAPQWRALAVSAPARFRSPHPAPPQIAAASGLGVRVRFELQYRRVGGGGGGGSSGAEEALGPGGWASLVGPAPAFEVGGLAAGSKYAFRGRGGAVNTAQGGGEEVAWGKWSVESVYATTGGAVERRRPGVCWVAGWGGKRM
jgi:hypothetical protein